jgi:hypothetical protein
MQAGTRAHVVEVYISSHAEFFDVSQFTVTSSDICFIRDKN